MSVNLILALVAGLFWCGAFFWYFRGGERISADLKGVFACLAWWRKPAGEDREARQ